MTVTASHCHPSAAGPLTGPRRALFAVVPLVAGFIPASLTFALNSHAAEDIGLSAVPVPAAVFVAVWLVIYPAMGMAAAELWHRRGSLASPADVCVPLAVLVAGFLQTTAFWFSDGLRGIAGMDATGVVLSATTVWVFSRYSPAAARWLLPWAIWMPITFLVKVGVLTGLWG